MLLDDYRRLVDVQQQRIQELTVALERPRGRVAVFGDLFHIPQWRLCAVNDCPVVLRSPTWFCAQHVGGLHRAFMVEAGYEERAQ